MLFFQTLMDIRFMGSPDLLERIKQLNRDRGKLYLNRNSDDCRYFVQLDDRLVVQWLDLLENADTPIQIDPKDFG
ncbi:MAG: hypothetical protein AAGK97_16195 [Bacteroidota bacterium]